jgi:hypothetical protein
MAYNITAPPTPEPAKAVWPANANAIGVVTSEATFVTRWPLPAGVSVAVGSTSR